MEWLKSRASITERTQQKTLPCSSFISCLIRCRLYLDGQLNGVFSNRQLQIAKTVPLWIGSFVNSGLGLDVPGRLGVGKIRMHDTVLAAEVG